MIRRPPRSTLDRSSAASDVYKRQINSYTSALAKIMPSAPAYDLQPIHNIFAMALADPVSYTHLRAHETVLDLVCRLLLEKKKTFK